MPFPVASPGAAGIGPEGKIIKHSLRSWRLGAILILASPDYRGKGEGISRKGAKAAKAETAEADVQR